MRFNGGIIGPKRITGTSVVSGVFNIREAQILIGSREFAAAPIPASQGALSFQTTDTTGAASNAQGGTNNVWTNLNSSSYANSRAELPSSGFWYFELVTGGGSFDNNASVGLMSMNGNNILNSAHWDSSSCTHLLIRRGNPTNSAFQESDTGDGSLTGSNLTNHTSISWISDPVVFMVAWDGTNKKAWMGINGTWINNDTPNTGGTNSQNWSAVTGGRVGIAVSAYTVNSSFTIRSPGNHSYSPPSGFTAGGV